jgi:lipid-binding SYLF domain-containing protein
MPSIFASFWHVAGWIIMFALTQSAVAQSREDMRLMTATKVMEELQATRDQAIPDRLLERAYGIAVVPDVAKVAFVAGGRRGKGVLIVRDKNGRFTSPVFISLTGGSIGWQAGVQQSDVVLVFTTRTGIEGITDGKLTLGGDASVAAGPVGRQASAATDVGFSAEVYSYSRARGLFAGIALDGTAMTIDRRANANFYKKAGVSATDIINGSVTSNDTQTQQFLAVVQKSTSPGANTSLSAAPATVPTPATPATQVTPATGAQSYPLEDTTPGQEPQSQESQSSVP